MVALGRKVDAASGSLWSEVVNSGNCGNITVKLGGTIAVIFSPHHSITLICRYSVSFATGLCCLSHTNSCECGNHKDTQKHRRTGPRVFNIRNYNRVHIYITAITPSFYGKVWQDVNVVHNSNTFLICLIQERDTATKLRSTKMGVQ